MLSSASLHVHLTKSVFRTSYFLMLSDMLNDIRYAILLIVNAFELIRCLCFELLSAIVMLNLFINSIHLFIHVSLLLNVRKKSSMQT